MVIENKKALFSLQVGLPTRNEDRANKNAPPKDGASSEGLP